MTKYYLLDVYLVVIYTYIMYNKHIFRKGNKMAIYIMWVIIALQILALTVYIERANKKELQEHKRKYYGGI